MNSILVQAFIDGKTSQGNQFEIFLIYHSPPQDFLGFEKGVLETGSGISLQCPFHSISVPPT